MEGFKQMRNRMCLGDAGVTAVLNPGLQGQGPTEYNVVLDS